MEAKAERLKAERTNLRRFFTQAANMFEEVHKNPDAEGKNLNIQYNKVTEKAERLFKVDDELKNLIAITDEEYDTVESYRDRFTEIRVIYSNYINQKDECKSVESRIITDNLKLPKLNLKEYDLMPRAWVAFWGQFSRIHDDENLREEDKFQYLLSSLKPKTKGRDIAESYPPSKGNYQKVIDHLKSRFGRNDLLIEVYIRDLLALVNDKSNVKLSELYDKLGSYLRALETLGVTTQNYAAMLYPVVESCIPTEVLKAWDRYRLNREDREDAIMLTKDKVLENLMDFLSHEVEGEEHRILAECTFGNTAKNKKDSYHPLNKNEPTAATLVSVPNTTTSKNICIFCNRNHSSQDCIKASTMNYDEKKTQVMRKRCCLVCLKPGHMAKFCHSSVKCVICGRRHYALLCPNLRNKDTNSLDKEKGNKSEKSSVLFTDIPSMHEIYLKTILVRLHNNDKQLCVRALLDDGSHRSYIEKDLAKELKLTASGKEILSQGLFGGGNTPAAEHGRYKVTVESMDRKFSTDITMLDQPKICTTLPRIRDEHLISELSTRGIKLTDTGIDAPPIKILLGADVLGRLLTGRIEVLNSGISAVETLFGWTILGLGKKKQVISMVTVCLQNVELQKLWEIETLGITDPIEKKDKLILDKETLIHFRETLKVNEDQRYEVSLPWLVGHPPIYKKQNTAETRLQTTTKRLLRENLFESYHNVFQQWQSEGIIEEVNTYDETRPSHYLPHRPVIKMSSTTTKIRPVFDASVKSAGYASLNDCLSTGPSLIQQIPPLLNRFRSGAIGVTADIKQAFLQISVRQEDRDVLRFLWWQDRDRTAVKEYRHCRVVFGVTSSPFLLNATIAHHLSLKKFQSEALKFTIERLKGGFYVDNFITSVEDSSKLDLLQSQAKDIMKKGCFDLRCWTHTGSQDGENQSVLGLNWNTTTDELTCNLPEALLNSEKGNTKRSLLSVINSIYDPVGFTCPAMLLPKLLLQETWKRKLEWDEPLPEDLQLRFGSWLKHLHLVTQCTIPRRMLRGIVEAATLHIFSDASLFGYACCGFLRCEEQSRVSVCLVSAKSRIAPMNQPTIPRMELLGATIAARLAKSILEALNLNLETYYWTDSMVVLA